MYKIRKNKKVANNIERHSNVGPEAALSLQIPTTNCPLGQLYSSFLVVQGCWESGLEGSSDKPLPLPPLINAPPTLTGLS